MLSTITISNIRDIPIEDIASDLDITVRNHKSLCSFHDDHHPSMKFWPSSNTCRCFVCNETWNNISLVMRHKNMNFLEACRWIGNARNIFIEEDTRRGAEATRTTKRSAEATRTTKRSAEAREGIRSSAEARVMAQARSKPPSPNTYHLTPNTIDTLAFGLVEASQSMANSFCKAAVESGYLTAEQMQRAANRYHLGSTKAGDVIFWQIDERQRVREGKIMAYENDCHRSRVRKPMTVSWLMKHRMKDADGKPLLPDTWRYAPCLFGLHLLSTGTVAIVESEKTAIICSEWFPECTWMATGGMGNLSVEMLRPLVDTTNPRPIIVFPDTDPEGKTYQKWKAVCEQAKEVLGQYVMISDLLERMASKEEKERKVDVVDAAAHSNTQPRPLTCPTGILSPRGEEKVSNDRP